MEIVLLNSMERPFEEHQGAGFSGRELVGPAASTLGGAGTPRRLQGAGLALQLLLFGPPGPAPRALRAGVRRGAEHLLEAASAVVRPAYFRLKGQIWKHS